MTRIVLAAVLGLVWIAFRILVVMPVRMVFRMFLVF